MKEEKDFKDFLRHLNDYHVEYCIVGGFAVIYHSRPRFTGDIDILIKPSPDNSKKAYMAMRDFGADVSNIEPDYFALPGHFYQIGVPPVQIHILNALEGIEVGEIFKNKIRARYGRVSAYYISLSDLISNKESAGRPVDKLDIEALKIARSKSKKRNRAVLE